MNIEITDEMKALVDNELGDIDTGYCHWGEYRDSTIKRIIELHEQSKPKPEPYGWWTDMYNDWCNEGDKGTFPLYKEPPTRKPLDIYKIPTNGTLIVDGIMLAPDCSTSFILGVRFAEQAHGIGTTNEST